MIVAGVSVVRIDGRRLLRIQEAIVASYDPTILEQDIRFKLNRRLSDISGPDSLPNMVYRVLDAAEREGWLIDLLTMLGDSRYPAVREIAARVLVEVGPPVDAPLPLDGGGGPGNGSVVADPYFRSVVAQRPFVDRTILRAHLKDLLSNSLSRVLVVTGERPCGKSYTWTFARQPDLLDGFTPVLVDLADWSDPSVPIDVMSSVALQLKLPRPTVDEHAQGAAQAQRLRDWLVGQLNARDPSGRWLLVFDSLDHVAQREETLQLIEFLAGAAIRQRLDGLRVILLGYANRIPIRPLESVLTEEIRDIGAPELKDFFLTLVQQEKLAISDQAIDLAVQDVLNRLPAEREQKLYQLPRTVREVGNAVFGRQVLP